MGDGVLKKYAPKFLKLPTCTHMHTHAQNITCHFKIQPQPGEAINYFHEEYTKRMKQIQEVTTFCSNPGIAFKPE